MRGRPAAFEKANRAWSAGWISPNESGNLSEPPFDPPGVAELRVAPTSMGWRASGTYRERRNQGCDPFHTASAAQHLSL